jgi:hypothetical protein
MMFERTPLFWRAVAAISTSRSRLLLVNSHLGSREIARPPVECTTHNHGRTGESMHSNPIDGKALSHDEGL